MTLEESEAYCKKQGWYYDYSISVEQNKPGTLIFLTVPEKMPENVVKNGEVVIQYDRIKTRNGPVMIGTLQQWSRET